MKNLKKLVDGHWEMHIAKLTWRVRPSIPKEVLRGPRFASSPADG